MWGAGVGGLAEPKTYQIGLGVAPAPEKHLSTGW